MVLKQKLREFWNNNFRLSILDIALCGIFVALWIVSYKFISINLVFMRIGLTYAWAIIIGLIFKPFVALTLVLIADNLTLLFTNIGYWMIEYALIYPLIVLLVSMLKKVFYLKNDKIWATFIILILFSSILITGIISLIYRNFVNNSKNEESYFAFNNLTVYIIIWMMLGLILCSTILMLYFYFKTKHQKLKINLTIFAFITLVIILFIWVWGPIAQIRYLTRHFGKSHHELFKIYEIYLVPRILKTPILIPVYFIIISSVYQAYQSLSFYQKTRW